MPGRTRWCCVLRGQPASLSRPLLVGPHSTNRSVELVSGPRPLVHVVREAVIGGHPHVGRRRRDPAP